MTTPVAEGGTPPAAPNPSVPAQSPAPPPAPATPAPDDQNPPWLADRLTRHEQQILKRFGVKTEDEIKTALEAQRATEESKKTLERKHADAEKRQKELEDDNSELAELVGKLAASKMASLTDAQRQAIEGVAGDDPRLQLSLIEAFSATWGAGAQPVTPGAPKPGQTAAPSPPPPAPGTPKTDFEKWADLKTTDPVAASLFYQMNSMRIEQSRPRT